MKNLSLHELLSLRDKVVTIEEVPTYAHLQRYHVSRKDLAASARQLFKQLGIKGISVTAPNYSMAQAVHVRIPHIQLPEISRDTCTSEEKDTYLATHREGWEIREEINRGIRRILFDAYPNHRDRSDAMSDYYDFCWSVF